MLNALILDAEQLAASGEESAPRSAHAAAGCGGVITSLEPFGALDAQTRTHLRREIRALLRKVNVPAVFITHDQEEALELGDRVAVLNVGHIEQIGTPYEIWLALKFIIECDYFTGRVVEVDGGSTF